MVKAAAEQALDAMVSEKEISGYEILLEDKQNILSTGKIRETVRVVPRGQVNTIQGVVEFQNPAIKQGGK